MNKNRKKENWVLFGIDTFLALLIIFLCLNCCGSCHHNTPYERFARNGDSVGFKIIDDHPNYEYPDTIVEETPGAEDSDVRRAEGVGQSGALKVTLLWDFSGDIDLHVKQPNGKEIFYNRKEDSSTGGYLDVDNVIGGSGSAENIYWEKPRNGHYEVSLVYYQPSEGNGVAGSGNCTVVVFQEGKEPRTYKVHMSRVHEHKRVTEFDL